MILVANYNTLTIERATDNGLYLVDDEQNEVLLPNRYIPENYELGDQIDVFVYFDSEDRPVAIVPSDEERPKLIEGGIACLKVVGFNFHGAFLDWGLAKDLFVPKANQTVPMRVGEYYTVGLYVDNVSGRPVGTAKLGRVINNDEITVRQRDEISVLVALRLERGFRCVVNDRHWGMIYDNQLFTDVRLGDRLTGYVDRVTDDGRIDILLQKKGFDQVQLSAEALLKIVDENGGKLPLGDKSAPEDVAAQTSMSKKVFRRSIGYLMSQGLITASEDSIERVKK